MPLSLSDDELAAIQATAAPIHPHQRGAFLQALAKELEGHLVVGPGPSAPPRRGPAASLRHRSRARSVSRRRAARTSASD
jgi:hypothetical protein